MNSENGATILSNPISPSKGGRLKIAISAFRSLTTKILKHKFYKSGKINKLKVPLKREYKYGVC